MRISSTSRIIFLATTVLFSPAPSVAADAELTDFSCPTSAEDEPVLFPEGAQPLTVHGVIHMKDRHQNYELRFTPTFDPRQGYVGDILIYGRKYTRNPTTQEKVYKFDQNEFNQEIVEFPFVFCRSNKVPYRKGHDQILGQLNIVDDTGATRSSRVRMDYVKNCRLAGWCSNEGLGVRYDDQKGDSTAIEFGRGLLDQDLRLMPRGM